MPRRKSKLSFGRYAPRWKSLKAADSEKSKAIPKLASGIVGIGGGVLLSPILLLKRWATPKGAAATSAIFVWVNSLASLSGAALSNQMVLDFETLLPFIFAVLIGGFLGSRYGADVAPQYLIRKLLVIVLVVASVKRIMGLL